MAQTQSNVNHLWRESEFAENKCPNKVVHSETKKSSYQQCYATQLPGLAVGREDGQLQQLWDQAEPHQSACYAFQLPGPADGREVG